MISNVTEIMKLLNNYVPYIIGFCSGSTSLQKRRYYGYGFNVPHAKNLYYQIRYLVPDHILPPIQKIDRQNLMNWFSDLLNWFHTYDISRCNYRGVIQHYNNINIQGVFVRYIRVHITGILT